MAIFLPFIITLAAAFLTPLCAQAQQTKKVPRIGLISASDRFQAFRQGLRDLGYTEGKNIVIEHRHHQGRLDLIPSLVAELVELNVDALVVESQQAIRTARKATKTIPVIMVSSVDPVVAGHVDSLARPGGNVTGISQLSRDLSAKRVELLKEVLPNMRRLAVLWDTQGPGPKVAFKEYEAAAHAFKLDFQSLGVSGPNPDLERAFHVAKNARRDALIIVSNPLIGFHQGLVLRLASMERLPSMYESKTYVESGGLLSYGANPSDSFYRAAYYVDRILKGAKPADFPVEQPTKFELVINLKTARQIGLTIPPNVLARADKVIK
ncbi:MAG: ABC transporter substrate-binding protein [Deltaproteobacteria bacterium]|nr:ABC transporter substrate-binding protein [Deltaproteobacteria bacterium]